MPIFLPCFISVFLILSSVVNAQTNKNITLGSSITAGDISSSWVSPSKDFAFGFQQVEPGNFLLAIWFNKIPQKTISWSANRDKLAPSGSKVELASGRSLILSDPRGQELWRAKLSSGSPAYAALLDTGNLVVSKQDSVVLWQSFDEPTDTLLPSQTLGQGAQLIAPYSEQNYSSGRFSFDFTTDGNLALYTTNFPLFDSLNSDYLDYESQGLGFQVVYNQSGLLYLVGNNGSILTHMFSEDQVVSEDVLYQRAILEHDGVLRHYVYPKGSAGWSVKSFAPNNICTAKLQDTGSGVCGFNSYCQFGSDSKPHCLCPPGYSLLDPNYEMGGCYQNFPSQNCEAASKEKNEFDLRVLINVDWPLSDYEHYQNVTIDWCREVCLDDCFCAVGVFEETGDCWKKKLPLSNGRNDGSVDRTTFIKVRINDDISEKNYRKSNKDLIVLLSTSGLTNIVLLVAGFCFCLLHKKHIHVTRESKTTGKYSIHTFSYKELDAATAGFKEELGQGAFGVVYKGVIDDISGSPTSIAVKKLDKLPITADKEFTTEVKAIGQTHHKNLVRLVGFCEEGIHKMLVYEFMSNGTLSDYICGLPKPAWEKRLQIVHDIARGLFYLHEDCNSQIIHCDIKPQNILLDDDHNARISDFGLAKLLGPNQSHTYTVARGTRGYVAPEWFRHMPITAKVDVYSFGILLLEVICCQRNVQAEDNEDGGFVLLTEWASECYKMNTLDDLVNGDTEALANIPKLEQLVKIVLWCTEADTNLRPTMRMVLQMLEGLVKVPDPPNPSSYSSSMATRTHSEQWVSA
ncbi:G-type lectin S-receptor-like serine/threonine-protein kinase LECRK1 [Silene latifolia]|uniref:G-type lectin S-receptor-like serine/threonine-protein kinase LECRK1 n=1 Tax=Silene latifolia TaxID=37657 RepID=UPI003D7824CC